MELRDYAACDATELRRLLSAGEVTAAELRDAALRAVEAVDPRLNATVSGPYEDAEGDIPFAAKDTLSEAGRPLGFGTRLLDGFVAKRDATLAERFRAAGLASLVRSATPEFAFNLDTAPVSHGPTGNPWNPEHSPGGSSGGAAALVASRALPLAHANDGGGSIRVPAAWCGLVGLKPSRGRVPLGPSVGEAVGGFAHEFVVTRSVPDAAWLLAAISGPAAGDRYYVEPFAPGPASGPLRVALHTESFFGVDTDPDVRAAVEDAARALESLGHTVEPACPKLDTEQLRRCVTDVWSVDLAELAATFAAATGRDIDTHVEAASRACIHHGRDLTALDLQDAARVVNSTGRRWGRFLDEYDLFLCPTTPTAATASGTPDQDDAAIDSAEDWIDRVFSLSPFTPVANLTGQPSISLPLGTSAGGLPIGVMLTAQTLREDVLLGVAAQLEQALPWAARTPKIDAAAS